ncbi:UNVERIFIED_CONTAM: porin, partial [Salmonella enterica]
MRISSVKKTVAMTTLAAVAPFAFAQQASTSSVQLYGIVDMAYRHTNNEGPVGSPGGSLSQMVGGGMSQSRWGINVSEDLGGGTKALVNLEN